MSKIIVGIDGSQTSKEALRWAVRLGAALNYEVEAITAWEFPVIVTMAGGGVLPGTWVPEDDAREVLQSAIREVAPNIKGTIAEGHPAHVMIEASKRADILVIGSRGLGGFRGALLGSVSTAVTQHAGCPVFVVPPVPDQED